MHVKAAGVLLSRRETPSREVTRAIVMFERICIESFLYHSTLMMLYDPSLDGISIANLPSHINRVNLDDPEDPATHPVLNQSYRFFVMIAEVTQLARISRPLNGLECQKWKCLQAEILQKEHTAGTNDLVQTLYLIAMKVLLLKADSLPPAVQIAAAMHAYSRKALRLIYELDIERYLLSYALWPVGVFGAIAKDEEEQRIVESKLAPWISTRRGQAIRLQERLRRIWAMPVEDEETVLPRRLQMLLDAK